MKLNCFLACVLAISLAGCYSYNGTVGTGPSASKPSTVVGAVGTGITNFGLGIGTSKIATNGFDGYHPFAVSDSCDTHAAPKNRNTGLNLSSSDPDYPGELFYCLIAYDTGGPDSIQGSYGNFLNFLHDLETNLRIVDISAITFSSDTFSGSGSTSPDSYKYNFAIKTYWLKN